MESTMMRPLQMVDVLGQYRRYQQEINDAILNVVASGAYINGPAVKQFERNMQEYLGVKHAIGCASGTDALQIAMMALGIGKDDEIITTPFTFAATTETIVLLGAKPVYVDIEPDTYNIDVTLIAERITPKTKAILPVHLFGQPCNMTEIMNIASKYHLKVIEDAAQAVGAKWNGTPACSIGDIACISFYPSKNLGAFGDAGMMTTNNDDLASAMRVIANHGSEKTYYHSRLGVNSRLDSIQAAILDVKLKYLDEWNARRREIASIYTGVFSQSPEYIITPHTVSEAEHIWHQYSILIRADRQKVMSSLKEQGIPTNIYYPIPLHKQDAYRMNDGTSFLNAEYAADHILALPMHSELSDDDAHFIAENVLETVKRYAQ